MQTNQPINTAAIVEAVLRASKSDEELNAIAIGRAVRDNEEAWEEVFSLTDCTDTDDLLMIGFGFGVMAGIMYGHGPGGAQRITVPRQILGNCYW